MLENIKNKLFNTVTTVVGTQPAKPRYAPEIEQIHHEFETAAERLISEAYQVIKQAKDLDADKVQRLEKMGFVQTQQVTQVRPLIEKAKLSEKQIELLKHYKMKYQQKFITEDQVKEICFKYNLVCGPVGKYKGFVPEKNLRDIEKFKVRDEDQELEFEFGGQWFNLEALKEPNSFHPGGWYDCYTKQYEASIQVGKPMNKHARYKNSTLNICAPVKDMDMTGQTITGGYKVQQIHIPDPVVLQSVFGGYLIITAWGDEASDPIVVNQDHN